MIAHIQGKILNKTPTSSILSCQGVGYEVFHTPFTAESLSGETGELHIYTNVREDNIQLFGFAHLLEKELFIDLIKISGVGPKLALGILSGLPPMELRETIAAKDVKQMQKLPGVGRKTAERIVIELSDRFAKESLYTRDAAKPKKSEPARDQELESVLTNLGYQMTEIRRTLKKLDESERDLKEEPLEIWVKEALAELNQTGSRRKGASA